MEPSIVPQGEALLADDLTDTGRLGFFSAMFVAIRVVTSEGVCRRVFALLYLVIGIIRNIYKNATHSMKKVIADRHCP